MRGTNRDGSNLEASMTREFLHKLHNVISTLRLKTALLHRLAEEGSPASIPEQLDKMDDTLDRLEHLAGAYGVLVSPAPETTEAVDVSEVVEEMLAPLRVELEKRGIALTATVADQLPQLRADRFRLQEALRHLILNARQALAAGGRISVRADQVVGRSQVLLEVADTGPGIPEDLRAKVFEPFFTTNPDRLGLGLAMVKRVVEEAGGGISLDSVVGQGTTVRLLLPAVKTPRPALVGGARRQVD